MLASAEAAIGAVLELELAVASAVLGLCRSMMTATGLAPELELPVAGAALELELPAVVVLGFC